MTIEEALQKLEQITSQLEKDELPLGEAMTLFEEGLALAAETKKELDGAKLRIEKAVEQVQGTFSLLPFDAS